MFGVKKEKGGALEMKKYISFFAKVTLMFALMILVGNANTVLAEETTEANTEKTYTVTFRAGNTLFQKAVSWEIFSEMGLQR